MRSLTLQNDFSLFVLGGRLGFFQVKKLKETKPEFHTTIQTSKTFKYRKTHFLVFISSEFSTILPLSRYIFKQTPSKK